MNTIAHRMSVWGQSNFGISDGFHGRLVVRRQHLQLEHVLRAPTERAVLDHRVRALPAPEEPPAVFEHVVSEHRAGRGRAFDLYYIWHRAGCCKIGSGRRERPVDCNLVDRRPPFLETVLLGLER